MSVNPGFGGQKFIPQTINKINRLSTMINKNNPSVKIAVDGGINKKNINEEFFEEKENQLSIEPVQPNENNQEKEKIIFSLGQF
jgi:copper homeostasis protein CutC